MNILKLVTVILDFVTLAVGCTCGYFCLGHRICYLCDKTHLYLQVIDITVYGLLLLIFFVCIAVMAKEPIQPKLQLTISFSSAIVYAVPAILIISLICGSGYGGDAYMQLSLLIILILLHLLLGLLHAFKEKIFGETE